MINNIDVLQNAVLTDSTTVNASMYHDSFIWRTIPLRVNERCLPVILVTSDSIMDETGSTFEDIVDAYLAYLQLIVVDPAMEKALLHLQQFALDSTKWKGFKRQIAIWCSLETSSTYKQSFHMPWVG